MGFSTSRHAFMTTGWFKDTMKAGKPPNGWIDKLFWVVKHDKLGSPTKWRSFYGEMIKIDGWFSSGHVWLPEDNGKVTITPLKWMGTGKKTKCYHLRSRDFGGHWRIVFQESCSNWGDRFHTWAMTTLIDQNQTMPSWSLAGGWLQWLGHHTRLRRWFWAIMGW